MKYVIIGIVFLIVAVGLYFVLRGKNKSKNRCYTKAADGSMNEVQCSSDKCYKAGSDTNSLIETPCSSNTAPHSSKSVEDYIGWQVIAKVNGTKLYDDDLNVVASYMAGETIGTMGPEATGNSCCNNHGGFYKIYSNPHVTGWCQCDPVMSKASLKTAFGIN